MISIFFFSFFLSFNFKKTMKKKNKNKINTFVNLSLSPPRNTQNTLEYLSPCLQCCVYSEQLFIRFRTSNKIETENLKKKLYTLKIIRIKFNKKNKIFSVKANCIVLLKPDTFGELLIKSFSFK